MNLTKDQTTFLKRHAPMWLKRLQGLGSSYGGWVDGLTLDLLKHHHANILAECYGWSDEYRDCSECNNLALGFIEGADYHMAKGDDWYEFTGCISVLKNHWKESHEGVAE